MLWSTEWFLFSILILGVFSCSPCNPLFIFFNFFFFLLNNFFVEWARPGERPGDEKMGPVRNPSQWGNLPEPPGGPAAGKCWGQMPVQTLVLEFSLLLLSRVSLNFTCQIYRPICHNSTGGKPVLRFSELSHLSLLQVKSQLTHCTPPPNWTPSQINFFNLLWIHSNFIQ